MSDKILGYTRSEWEKIAAVASRCTGNAKFHNLCELKQWHETKFDGSPDSCITFAVTYFSIEGDRLYNGDWVNCLITDFLITRGRVLDGATV